MDWASQRPLMELAIFILAMAIVGRARWIYVPLFYVVYRMLNSELTWRIVNTLPRDLRGLRLLFKVKWNIKWKLRENRPLMAIWLDVVKRLPRKVAIREIETGREVTIEELNGLANQYANHFQGLGYRRGDVVAMFMENGIDFVAAWLGLAKIGVITAWINSNLKLQPLAHSISVAKTKAIICSTSLLKTLNDARIANLLDRSPTFIIGDYSVDDNKDKISLSQILTEQSKREPMTKDKIDFQSVLCYIYTSGTTGNPKPAIIKHFRFYWMAMGSASAFQLTSQDRMYITMPMYHSAAGVLGVGQLVTQGSTLITRKRFSASAFWKDCVQYRCTASQYIGEICRYLLAQPPGDEREDHCMRVMFGNGLRTELWNEFVRRFRVAKIGELYGSTEGNSNIVNIDNHPGACGFFPIYPRIGVLYPLQLIKIDEESGEPVRDSQGLCIRCRPGDTGEMVGVIKSDPLHQFEGKSFSQSQFVLGYVDKTDTDRKVIRNAFRLGDQVFSSGDILHWDRMGYLFFKDRRGDTFRWKGENVSTTEVEGILQPMSAIQDSTVYGVTIPGKEGRAGMAAVVLDENENVDREKFLCELAERLSANLASFAIPVFLRLCKTVERTGTFKLKKITLQKAGYVNCADDPVFFWDSTSRRYLPLTESMQRSIDDGSFNRL